MDVNLPGVYKITCLQNQKFYIGSAKIIHKRWTSHRQELRHNRHHSPYFQNSWNKYGEKQFLFEIVENCALDVLSSREQHYLDTLKPYKSDIGFNTSKTSISYNYNLANDTKWRMGASLRGKKHKLESIQLMSNGKIGAKNPMFGKIYPESGKVKLRKALKGRVITWNQELKITRNIRPLKIYYMVYTIQTPANEIVTLETWAKLKEYLRVYNNNVDHFHKRVGIASLIKHKNYRGIKLLKIIQRNVENMQEIIKYSQAQ